MSNFMGTNECAAIGVNTVYTETAYLHSLASPSIFLYYALK